MHVFLKLTYQTKYLMALSVARSYANVTGAGPSFTTRLAMHRTDTATIRFHTYELKKREVPGSPLGPFLFGWNILIMIFPIITAKLKKTNHNLSEKLTRTCPICFIINLNIYRLLYYIHTLRWTSRYVMVF